MSTIDFIDIEAVSHELSTPLTILILQLQLMEYYLDDKEKLREFIKIASRNAHRLTRHIGNFLDILKIDAGYLGIDLAAVDVYSLIQDICDSVEPYAGAKSIRLIRDIPPCRKVMLVDIEKMERILFNLLSNALKFSDQKGEVVVRAEDNYENGVRFSVSDTGEGISEEKARWITDPESSLVGTNKGCGLPLVKLLTQLLGGSIALRSKAGEGSTFTITLPLAQTPMPGSNAFGLSLSRKAEIELSDLDETNRPSIFSH